MIAILTKSSSAVKVQVFSRIVFVILGAFLVFLVTFLLTFPYTNNLVLHNLAKHHLAALIPLKQTFEARGNLIVQTDQNIVHAITLITAQGSAATPIDLAGNHVVIDYRDANQRLKNLVWRWEFLEPHDHDTLLEAGELVRFTVPLTESLVHPLPMNTAFVLDVIPQNGTILTLKSKTPSQFNPSIELTLR